MANEPKTQTKEPLLVANGISVYEDSWYEVSRKISAKGPSIPAGKLTSGVIYMRGGYRFTETQPSHIVQGRELLRAFTLVQDKRFDTDPTVLIIDPNLAVREMSKAEAEARGK